ncbi:MAG TPA: amino acid permease [Amycolatopsis sp.]|nr:amino acid permease [Amycolatopsis sp.]
MSGTQPEETDRENPGNLGRHLTLVPAVALAVTTVIGGGALALPGVALAEAGNNAILGWVLAAVITIPLIVVFARLGAKFPSAGGIAGFVQSTFGRPGAAGVEVVFIGTVILGMPAIALSGGGYLAAALGCSPGWAWLGATVLLVLATGLLSVGAVLSARVQTVLAVVLTLALAAVGVLGLGSPAARFTAPSLDLAGWRDAFAVVGIVFFGFTGWEIVAFTLGEYRNPKRDFPRVMALSFVIVVGVYLILAAGVQAVLDRGAPRSATAPIADLVSIALSPTAAVLVSVLGTIILGANLIGALWGASRLVYSSACEGLLPARLARLSGAGSVPRRAVLAVGAVFVLVVAASAIGLVAPTTMFEIAGQNFFLLYILAAVVFARQATTTAGRVSGVLIALALVAVVVVGFNLPAIIYPLVLFAIGVGAGYRRRRVSTVSQSVSPER